MKKNINAKLIFLFVIIITLLIYFFVVHKSKISEDIVNYIENQCHNESPCIIRISDFTPFVWDKMYYIKSGTSLDANPNLLGIKLPKNYGGLSSSKIVFLLNGELQHFEDIPTDIENIKNKEVKFDFHRFLKGEEYKIYNSEEAVFNVEFYYFTAAVNQKKPFVYYNLRSDLPLLPDEEVRELKELNTLQ